MAISGDLIKQLREQTQAGIMDCKEALNASGGDLEKAIDYLRKKGVAKAATKSSRVTKEGSVTAYVHPGSKIGVLVEVVCETDFVARNELFQTFSRDMAMHVAASNPLYLERSGVPEAVLAKEREVYREQLKGSGKPETVWDRIIQGKVDKFYTEVCLLDQPFIKDPSMSVQQYLTSVIAKLGENMAIRRFCRFQVGEALAE